MIVWVTTAWSCAHSAHAWNILWNFHLSSCLQGRHSPTKKEMVNNAANGLQQNLFIIRCCNIGRHMRMQLYTHVCCEMEKLFLFHKNFFLSFLQLNLFIQLGDVYALYGVVVQFTWKSKDHPFLTVYRKIWFGGQMGDQNYDHIMADFRWFNSVGQSVGQEDSG